MRDATEITVLPVSMTAEASNRLSQELTRAHRANVQLGSRVPHIETLSRNLQQQLVSLRMETVKLCEVEEGGAKTGFMLKALVEQLIEHVDGLISMSRKIATGL